MSRVLRCALVSFLFVLFVAQCVYSFLRFLEFGTTETFTTLKVRRQHFPGISLCPVERAAKVWTLGAEEERKRKEKRYGAQRCPNIRKKCSTFCFIDLQFKGGIRAGHRS